MGVRRRGEAEPIPICVEVRAADDLVRRHRRGAELELSLRGQRCDFYAPQPVARFQAGKWEVGHNEPVGRALVGRDRLVRGCRPVVHGALDGDAKRLVGSSHGYNLDAAVVTVKSSSGVHVPSDVGVAVVPDIPIPYRPAVRAIAILAVAKRCVVERCTGSRNIDHDVARAPLKVGIGGCGESEGGRIARKAGRRRERHTGCMGGDLCGTNRGEALGGNRTQVHRKSALRATRDRRGTLDPDIDAVQRDSARIPTRIERLRTNAARKGVRILTLAEVRKEAGDRLGFDGRSGHQRYEPQQCDRGKPNLMPYPQTEARRRMHTRFASSRNWRVGSGRLQPRTNALKALAHLGDTLVRRQCIGKFLYVDVHWRFSLYIGAPPIFG